VLNTVIETIRTSTCGQHFVLSSCWDGQQKLSPNNEQKRYNYCKGGIAGNAVAVCNGVIGAS
jgi:hypothetical protein